MNDVQRTPGGRKHQGEFDADRDESLRAMFADAFRGRMRWMSAVVWGYALLFTAVAVVAAVLFFRAAAVREQILWATVFTVSTVWLVLVKMWIWQRWNRNLLRRRIDALEARLRGAPGEAEGADR